MIMNVMEITKQKSKVLTSKREYSTSEACVFICNNRESVFLFYYFYYAPIIIYLHLVCVCSIGIN